MGSEGTRSIHSSDIGQVLCPITRYPVITFTCLLEDSKGRFIIVIIQLNKLTAYLYRMLFSVNFITLLAAAAVPFVIANLLTAQGGLTLFSEVKTVTYAYDFTTRTIRIANLFSSKH